jgi:Fe-S-cluster containining protein
VPLTFTDLVKILPLLGAYEFNDNGNGFGDLMVNGRKVISVELDGYPTVFIELPCYLISESGWCNNHSENEPLVCRSFPYNFNKNTGLIERLVDCKSINGETINTNEDKQYLIEELTSVSELYLKIVDAWHKTGSFPIIRLAEQLAMLLNP